LFGQKDYKDSEAAFRKAIELKPELLSPYLSLASLHMAKNEIPQAIAQYKEILERQPRFIQAYMALGVIYETQGNRAQACEMYDQALEINPDFSPAANNLAYLMLEQAQDPDRALNLAKKAKAQLPDDPNVMDTLGVAFIAKGLYSSAISELSGAADKLPQNPIVLYHLGLAHWKNGDRDQALVALQNALKITQTFPERQLATELLKDIQGS
jgi:tetratricopeptide (TPR) repeat protein